MCWTDKRRASQKCDRHGSALLETLLCVQPGSISIYSAGAHRLQSFLRLLSWMLPYELSATMQLPSLSEICNGASGAGVDWGGRGKQGNPVLRQQ